MLGDSNASATFSGTLQDGGGTLALRKMGTGVQVLGGNENHTGGTSIDNGTLSILGSHTSSAMTTSTRPQRRQGRWRAGC